MTFADAHITGDQAQVLPTDTQKNTAFAYAKLHGISSIEDYALALGRRLLEACPAASAAQVRVEEYAWDRLGDHSFVRRGGAVRTCVVTVGRDETHVLSGIQELVLLNSTDSEFKGFLKDEFTTLPETDDRILATSLVAKWRHSSTDVDWNESYDAVRDCLLATFATAPTRARCRRRCTRWARAVLDAQPGIAEIRFSAPNKHHFLVDFSGFDVEGLTNDGEVFIAADRPYGLIEAQVTRDDAPPAGDAWLHVRGSADGGDHARGAARLPVGPALGRRRPGRPAVRRPGRAHRRGGRRRP